MRIRLLESQARFGEEGRTLPGSIESAWVFSRRVLRAAKRNQDGVRVLKKEKEKKFSRAELLSLDRAGLMGVRPSSVSSSKVHESPSYVATVNGPRRTSAQSKKS